MAAPDGPVAISQRGLYFSTDADIIAAVKAEIAKDAPAFASLVGSDATDLVKPGTLVGKVVEGPTGLGSDISTTDIPVLGQEEADQFTNQPTRQQVSFGTQAIHTNETYIALRDLPLNTECAIAYSERESDTKWIVAVFIAKFAGGTYDGSVGTIYARQTFNFARQGSLKFVPQA